MHPKGTRSIENTNFCTSCKNTIDRRDYRTHRGGRSPRQQMPRTAPHRFSTPRSLSSVVVASSMLSISGGTFSLRCPRQFHGEIMSILRRRSRLYSEKETMTDGATALASAAAEAVDNPWTGLVSHTVSLILVVACFLLLVFSEA